MNYLTNTPKQHEIISKWIDDSLIPLVSICCSTYNHEKYIEKAIQGFLIQETKFPFEIIVRDDASNDLTQKILREIGDRYPKIIKLYFESENQYSKGFKVLPILCQLAKGKYIALCDGDDYWIDPLKLQKQVDILEHEPSYSLTFCNLKILYDDSTLSSHDAYQDIHTGSTDKKIQIFAHPENRTSFKDLSKGNYVHTPGVLFRNWIRDEGLPRYMTNVSIGDWPLHLFTASKGDLHYNKEVMGIYRVHNCGIWSSKNHFTQGRLSLGQYPPLLRSHVFDETTKTYWLRYAQKKLIHLIKIAPNRREKIDLLLGDGLSIILISLVSLCRSFTTRLLKMMRL